ncbi:hypothetical protein FACS1894217_02660 [Clostridia bacterium]|nr:hypothetical protein FACS1894217_02660 [Clostridia bacterium]
MRTINVAVGGQFARCDSKNAGVQGEYHETRLHLVFGNDWLNYGKRIVWRDAHGQNPIALPLAGQEAYSFIPAEALAVPGWCTFTIEGLHNGSVALTAFERLQVAAAINYNAPEVVTPDQALQILEQVEAAPTIIINNLYSSQGTAADLVVNRLRTDADKPWKYLDENLSNCYYHNIYGINDDWIEAVYAGPDTEQWENADGEPIWWKSGVVGGTFTTDEELSLDGDGNPTPVIVYKYAEHIKAATGFKQIPASWSPGGMVSLPLMVLGEGDQNGRSKAQIFKDPNGLCIEFLAHNGQTHHIRIDDDGIELKGLKRASLANGTGTETAADWFSITQPGMLFAGDSTEFSVTSVT